MAHCNHQYLERIAEVSRYFGKDERLSDSSRVLFSRAFDLADSSKYAFNLNSSLDEAFSLLCAACKAGGLDQCKGIHCGFISCHLLWNYSS